VEPAEKDQHDYRYGDSGDDDDLRAAAGVEAPAPLGRKAEARVVGPQERHTAVGEAVGDDVEQVTEQEGDEGDGATGSQDTIRADAGAQRFSGADEAQVVKCVAERVFGAPDEGADQQQAEEAVEDGAVPGESLDATADEASALADRAARIVDVGRQGAEGGAAEEDRLEQHDIDNLVRITERCAQELRPRDMKDTVGDDRAGETKDDV